jgi:hypothetical protein
VFAFPNVFHFFAHELACLSGRRFAFTLVLARTFNCFFFWHNKVVSPLTALLDVNKRREPLENSNSRATERHPRREEAMMQLFVHLG